MKKYLMFQLITLSSLMAYSQLYVSPTGYVFAKNTVLFVNQDVNLDSGGKVYLRNEAQLLQGTTTTLTANKGLGVLSVFQEGTSNNYGYNYWCSPIGLPSNAAANQNFGTALLGSPTSITATSMNIPVAGDLNGTATPFHVASRWIHTFQSATGDNYSQWNYINTASTIAPGLGFTMKGVAGADATDPGEGTPNNSGIGVGQRYDFRGKPNDGNIQILVNPSPNRTLTGNPYPSAIDTQAFLNAATNTTKVAYYWEHDDTVLSHVLANYRGGYATYTAAGMYMPAVYSTYDGAGNVINASFSSPGNIFARRYAPIGQGFMIQGLGAGGTVFMKNSFRTFQKESGGSSTFHRNNNNSSILTTQNTETVPQIRFKAMLNNLSVRTLATGFFIDATDGVDIGKEANFPDSGTPIDCYFVIDNNEYIISAINYNENKRIPIGFRSNTTASIKFKVDEMVHFTDAQNVFLFDSVTGLYHDIKNAIYEFSVPTGITNSRYEITFKNSNLLAIQNNTIENFIVSQNNVSQQLIVSNKNLIDLKSISLFDVTGKLIFDNSNLGNKSIYEFPTSSLSEGVYIVKVVSNNNDNFSQKVIVKK